MWGKQRFPCIHAWNANGFTRLSTSIIFPKASSSQTTWHRSNMFVTTFKEPLVVSKADIHFGRAIQHSEPTWSGWVYVNKEPSVARGMPRTKNKAASTSEVGCSLEDTGIRRHWHNTARHNTVGPAENKKNTRRTRGDAIAVWHTSERCSTVLADEEHSWRLALPAPGPGSCGYRPLVAPSTDRDRFLPRERFFTNLVSLHSSAIYLLYFLGMCWKQP